ncbi:hypothetical protein FCL53_17025 [Elizabethkingia meningoseptica]|uniref:hypothetical protein n=1 Tax=Elizabethkingia meningoseptica TaxID=238 RepID=UPI001365417A|nr:hypothetical protein [Elizabethkingia meningoseptica]MVW93667.1 hypothetical protein [Elizabethkingia meningoseptica]
MSEFKGTKGKWLLNPLRNPIDPEYYCLYVKEGDHTTVQHIGTITSQYNDNKKEMIFNAKLISKAPEMLAWMIKKYEKLNSVELNINSEAYKDYSELKELIKQATEL